MITIKDIAVYCNVSVSTVSYALSDNSTISEKTKARIRQAAKELNYIPNANARSLKKKATHKIGVFVPGFQGTIHPTILAGIAHVLRNIDDKYNMIVTFADEDMLLIKSHSVDIAIIMDGKTTPEATYKLAKYVPIITFDQFTNGDNIHNTSIDNFEAMRLLTETLISKGCKRIGFVLGSNASHHNNNRYDGYVKALSDNNIPLKPSIVYNANAFTVFKGHEVIYEAIHGLQTLPFDGLVCCNDELAIGAIDALKELGFESPTDYLITGFDNIERSVYTNPPLTTASVDWFDYGVKIAELALKIVRNQPHEHSFTITAEIIERKSTFI